MKTPVCSYGIMLVLLSLLAVLQATTALKVAGVPGCLCVCAPEHEWCELVNGWRRASVCASM